MLSIAHYSIAAQWTGAASDHYWKYAAEWSAVAAVAPATAAKIANLH